MNQGNRNPELELASSAPAAVPFNASRDDFARKLLPTTVVAKVQSDPDSPVSRAQKWLGGDPRESAFRWSELSNDTRRSPSAIRTNRDSRTGKTVWLTWEAKCVWSSIGSGLTSICKEDGNARA
jgi:hypothetical protein